VFILGGAAVTEELVQGYKFSRCSYVLSLLRKSVINELFPKTFFEKVKLFKRDPHSFTPMLDGRYLLFGSNAKKNEQEIAKFSTKDAENYQKFENFLKDMVEVIKPFIDQKPFTGKINLSWKGIQFLFKLIQHLIKSRNNLLPFYHFLTSSAATYLDYYFECEVLKSTLATDAVIGAMKSPNSLGSAYVLLHHVMGEIDEQGSWFYVQVK
jgi:phytoene dehydrogenase-like protein